ncbi:MAG: EAL domain-containing response regulator [Rhodoferax sp.]
MKILIAEDEPSLRQNLQWMLEMEGYQVLAACDGHDALAQAQATVPDLVITDVTMPNCDGYSLVKALRTHAQLSTVPIVMLSARADRGDVRMGMNLGADDYLTKPYRREELLDTIHTRLARSASLRQAAQRLRDGAAGGTGLDPLTALPQKDAFEAQLGQALRHSRSLGLGCAVVFIGLDGFAKINESLGKEAGDAVLRETAQRLSRSAMNASSTPSAHVAEHGFAGRVAGDQFALCLAGLAPQTLGHRVPALLEVVAQPIELQGNVLFLSACAGASECHDADTSHTTLMAQAESALYHAKPRGPGSWQLFDSALSQQVVRRLHLHNELHRSLDADELRLYYQPQIRIADGALVGFEALVRWQHQRLGWVSPGEFIPVAEESGIINRIGEWVMRTAAQQAAQWVRSQGHSNFHVAVNLSVRQFARNDLPTLVQSVLAETGLPAQVLELEVTESIALHSVSSTLNILNACKALGVKLSMDDFGTGYSSLSYLKRYPLDTLKIDQSFVRNIPQDAGDAAITRAIVAMAHSFGMTVIAEGVEHQAQLDFLRELGCEEFQGYLCSRPVPAEEVERFFDGFRLCPAAQPSCGR